MSVKELQLPALPTFIDHDVENTIEDHIITSDHKTRTFVGNLDEQAEALGGLEFESFGDVLAEILGACARLDLEGVVRVVREVDFVQDLRHSVPDRVNLHLVRRVLPRPVPGTKINTHIYIFSVLEVRPRPLRTVSAVRHGCHKGTARKKFLPYK